jgi:uncharacterized protein (DUF362 family)
MDHLASINRRSFLKSSALAGGGLLAARFLPFESTARADLPTPYTTRSQVAVTTGSDHIDNIFRAMQAIKPQIAAAIGNRPVLIKPNNVGGGATPLADTPCECLEGILAFLKSIGKTDVTVAECTLNTSAMLAFGRMGYLNLAKKYPVRFKALSEEGYQWMNVFKTGKLQNSVRVSKMLLDPNYFVISACRVKTHDRVVLTLSLKNIIMGSVIDDQSYFNNGPASMDKQNMHGDNDNNNPRSINNGVKQVWSYQDLNNTMCMLSKLLAPDLSVLDAYQGMQNQGPINGLPVEPQQAAIASLDFLSADRIGVELANAASGIQDIVLAGYCDGNNSGYDGWKKYPAYLNYCAQKSVGQYDTSYIDLVGDVTNLAGLSPLVKKYNLSTASTTGASLWLSAAPACDPIGTDRRLRRSI